RRAFRRRPRRLPSPPAARRGPAPPTAPLRRAPPGGGGGRRGRPPADLLRFLRDVRLFTRFAEPELIALAESLHERRLRKNQLLFREGDPGDKMFIVRQGAILVSKAIRARVEQVLDHVRPADFIGEMS